MTDISDVSQVPEDSRRALAAGSAAAGLITPLSMPDAASAPLYAPFLKAEAYPTLTDDQLSRLRAYGESHSTAVDDIIFRAGDTELDLIVVEAGAVEISQVATLDAGEELVNRFEAGHFIGELNLLTGQTLYLTARVVAAGSVTHISPLRFRALMAEEPDLSDLLLRAFIARRKKLQHGAGARSIEIVGSALSAASLALRTYAARQQLAHLWFDSDSVAGQSLLTVAELSAADLPAVILPDTVLRNATPGELAEHVGLSYRRTGDEVVDLTVIGAGPAGLAAAMYGASEGLSTVLLDEIGTGGQAAASSRIENYLGFPSGLSGAELTSRAAVQSEKFGARLFTPCKVVDLDDRVGFLRVYLDDGTTISTRSIIIATGAHYRSLELPNWSQFEGAGIYYAATEIEARACGKRAVTVIGGANSSGQAALFLAGHGSAVTIAVRHHDIGRGMSSYLVDRLQAHPNVTIKVSTEVTELTGDTSLTGVVLTRATGETEQTECTGLFCFIGATPETSWLSGVVTDDNGFVLTDVSLEPSDLPECWASLGRSPLPFETSIPAVFAAGDVRLGSMKRVAAAVGEGASAVRSVHQAIGARV
ncbi:FAD-dependent oxidoreductase [Subtercola endophyticus]|uniref:FAD-dependent oxidoreductase n=1 Tax=Subtercola endophyticus TaxID=2895559 RepID=UPI001E4E6588|nr:FAD-dependent oxidoreductase [Subtercola endophyticus]UFS59989.1 FAD-dependent oxidoreductase [Subtercola endophyticus]